MDIRTIDNETVFIFYDTPSPDTWRVAYSITYQFPFDSIELKELMELDEKWFGAKRKELIAKGKPKEDLPNFYDYFSSDKKYASKLFPPEIKEHIAKIQANFLNNLGNISLIVNNELISDDKEKEDKIKELYTKGLKPRPQMPYKKKDFWIELTEDQKKHNDILNLVKHDSQLVKTHNEKVAKKQRGEQTIIDDYPYLENQKISDKGYISILKQLPYMARKSFEPDGRLLCLRWTFSEYAFTDDDLIINPYQLSSLPSDNLTVNDLLKLKYEDKKKSPYRKYFKSVRKAFQSARTNFTSRIQNTIGKQTQKSVYEVSLEYSYAPNDYKDKVNKQNPFYNENLDSPRFNWDIQKALDPQSKGFVIPLGYTMRDPPYIRYPNDPNAISFQEVFYASLLPHYSLLLEFMIDKTTNQLKKRFKHGYQEKIKNFEDFTIYIRSKPPSVKARNQKLISMKKVIENTNPDFLKPLAEKIDDLHTKYILNKEEISHGILENFLTNWKKKYFQLLENWDYAHPFDEREDYLDYYIENYNKFIDAYNKSKKTKEPKIEGTLNEKRQLGRSLLNAQGWYYSIPIGNFIVDDEVDEPLTIKERRKTIERKLFEMTARFEEEKTQKQFTGKERIFKKSLETWKAGGKSGEIYIIDKWKQLQTEPDRFAKPDIYKRYIEEIMGKENLPKTSEIVSEFKKEKETLQTKEKEEKEQIEERKAKIIKIETLRKQLSKDSEEQIEKERKEEIKEEQPEIVEKQVQKKKAIKEKTEEIEITEKEKEKIVEDFVENLMAYRREYENTGKKAIFQGKVTKGFKDWLKTERSSREIPIPISDEEIVAFFDKFASSSEETEEVIEEVKKKQPTQKKTKTETEKEEIKVVEKPSRLKRR